MDKNTFVTFFLTFLGFSVSFFIGFFIVTENNNKLILILCAILSLIISLFILRKVIDFNNLEKNKLIHASINLLIIFSIFSAVAVINISHQDPLDTPKVTDLDIIPPKGDNENPSDIGQSPKKVDSNSSNSDESKFEELEYLNDDFFILIGKYDTLKKEWSRAFIENLYGTEKEEIYSKKKLTISIIVGLFPTLPKSKKEHDKIKRKKAFNKGKKLDVLSIKKGFTYLHEEYYYAKIHYEGY